MRGFGGIWADLLLGCCQPCPDVHYRCVTHGHGCCPMDRFSSIWRESENLEKLCRAAIVGVSCVWSSIWGLSRRSSGIYFGRPNLETRNQMVTLKTYLFLGYRVSIRTQTLWASVMPNADEPSRARKVVPLHQHIPTPSLLRKGKIERYFRLWGSVKRSIPSNWPWPPFSGRSPGNPRLERGIAWPSLALRSPETLIY